MMYHQMICSMNTWELFPWKGQPGIHRIPGKDAGKRLFAAALPQDGVTGVLPHQQFCTESRVTNHRCQKTPDRPERKRRMHTVRLLQQS